MESALWAALSGLLSGTTYHYRVVAESESGLEVEYALVIAPRGMAINAATGEITVCLVDDHDDRDLGLCPDPAHVGDRITCRRSLQFVGRIAGQGKEDQVCWPIQPGTHCTFQLIP